MSAYIRRENLIIALSLAIDSRAEDERKAGYTGESALLQGWRTVYAALMNGEHVEVRS